MRFRKDRRVPAVRRWLPGLGLLGLCAGVGEEATLPTEANPKRFLGKSLEELAQIEVVSVNRREQPLQNLPAAVAVITGEDIRRTGVTTIADALRLAPGTDVARVGSPDWAVSIRGFNDTFANKLLVLMDGRSVYTPLFSGTFWHVQDTLLQDIDRIEVIRGPGGTVWGANAVNGVVNVVTKPASQTQGLLVSGGGGTFDQVLADLRYGGPLADEWFYRVYAKYNLRDSLPRTTGEEGENDWEKVHGGFRVDWEPKDDTRGHFTVQGDLYSSSEGTATPEVSLTPPYSQTGLSSDAEYAGGNLLARWVRPVGAFGEIQVQTYYDRTQLDFGDLEEARDTVDLDLRHRFAWGERQSVTWGGGYRYSGSDFNSSFEIGLDPGQRTYQVFNVFLQDEVAIVPDRWILTLGTKVEHNTYTGFEVEPGGRLAWLITPRQTLWGGVARAVRTPSDMEREGRINLEVLPPSPPTIPLPMLVSLLGSPESEAETMIAYELGYRSQVTPRLSLDVALFLNDYDELRGSVPQAPAFETDPVPHFLAASLFGNHATGQTYGGELSATWQAADWLRFQAAYSLFFADLDALPGAKSLEVETDASAPRHKAYLRTMLDLPHNLDLDLWLRYNGSVEGVSELAPSLTTTTIPEYLTLDARISWHPTDHWEFTVAGQNLLSNHQEFFPTFVSSESLEVVPSVYGRITFRF